MKERKKSSINDEEESGLKRVKKKCALFAQSFLPSKEQLNDKHLQNRMKLCALAIFLMWISTLRAAVYISSFAIALPPTDTIFASCKSAATVTMDEREKFSSCVENQGRQCSDGLDEAIEFEISRVDSMNEYNQKILRRVQDSLDTCVDDYTSLRRGLEGWVNELQIIPYKNDTCTSAEREGMLTTVGDANVLKAEALAVSVQYKRESQSTARNIVEYAKKRGEYDRVYMKEHADYVSNTVRDFVRDKEIPQFPLLFREINHMLVTFHLMGQCLTPSPYRCMTDYDYVLDTFIGPMIGIREVLYQFHDDYRATFVNITKAYNQQYRDLRHKIHEFRDKTNAAYEKTIEFYNGFFAYLKKAKKNFGFRTVYNILRLFVKWFKDMLELSLLQMKVLGIHLPRLPYYRIYYDRFYSIMGIDTPKKMWDTLKGEMLYWNKFNIAKGAIVAIDDVRVEVYESVLALRQKMLNQFVLPADYQPPQYVGISGNFVTLSEEEERYSNISEAFLEDSIQAIDSVEDAKFRGIETNISLAEKVNFTAIKTKLSNFDMNFEKLQPPGVEFELWFLQIASIGDLAFLIDYAFRIYFSIRLCFKYWDAGQIQLPKIDIRTHKEITNPFKFSHGRLFMYFFTNPLIGVLLGGLALVWIFGLVTSAYLPFYVEYRSGCIPKEGNGTFISENVYSLAYNFAYNDGSSSLVKTNEYLDTKKTNTCSVRYTSSAQRRNDDIVEYDKKLSSIQTVASRMDLFEQCIDVEVADAQYRIACCNQPGYEACNDEQDLRFGCPLNALSLESLPFSPPGDYIARQSCKMVNNTIEWQLDEAIFDCTTLPSCDMTCKSPHKEKIRKVTKECGCIVEWFFHSVWLRTILSFFIFIAMNVSRIRFINGLANFLWIYLRPAAFTVLATCDIDGVITTNDRDEVDEGLNARLRSTKNRKQEKYTKVSQGSKVASSIAAKIDRSTSTFEFKGKLVMIAALSINILWVSVVFITPDQTKIKWLTS